MKSGIKIISNFHGRDTLKHQEVERCLDKVRPAMEADGGGVDLVGVDSDAVYIKLKGACLDCPSVDLTMKQGLEKTLKNEFDWFQKVIRL